MNFRNLILLTLFIVLAGSFGFAGYSICKKTCTLPGNPPVIPATPEEDTPLILSKFEVGSPYFSDTVMLVSKDEPHITLIASVDRIEQTGIKAQTTRVSYFDGSKWTREVKNQAVKDFSISSNSLLKEWKINLDDTRVLKESLSGTLNMSGNNIKFNTQMLENEIGMRSLPGYTKYMSNSQGSLEENGKSYSAYVLFTRIYSLNAAEIAFYDKPLDLTTHWVAFWDNNGNFYHIDTTNVARPTELYKTHNIGVVESADKTVQKTFTVQVEADTHNPPSKYKIYIPTNAHPALSLDTVSSLDKSPKGTNWFMSLVKGKVLDQSGNTITEGFGLAEFVKDY